MMTRVQDTIMAAKSTTEVFRDMPEDSTEQEYVHGYSTASRIMAVRTAEREAAFFLPHLHPGIALLDAGCGPGTITVGLAAAVAPGQVVGIDIGKSEVDKASQLAFERGITNVVIRTGDVADMPFANGAFDALFSSAVLEHVPQREKALDEFVRVLKPGGVIGLRGGNAPAHVTGPQSASLTRLNEIYDGAMEAVGAVSDFGLKQMPLLLERGFENVVQTANYENRAPNDIEIAKRIVTDAFVKRAENLGISSREELEELSRALEANASNPLNYIHISMIEVVGRKPA